MLKLNLGCGNHCPEGWINIDSSPAARIVNSGWFPFLKLIIPKSIKSDLNLHLWPKGVRYMDLTRKFDFETSTVDFIFLSHVIEHLTEDEGEFMLSECVRVLKPGGVLRIITPDFNELIKEYRQNTVTNPSKAVSLFMRNSLYFELPYSGGLKSWLKLFVKRKNNHHFIYDAASLKAKLLGSGFSMVLDVDFQKSQYPEVFKSMDIADRFRQALAVEAVV